MEACSALAWVGNADDLVSCEEDREVLGRHPEPSSGGRFLETLITRPVPGTAAAILGSSSRDRRWARRHQAARAIGKAGFDAGIEASCSK
jgi:hypothetical protein